MVQIVCPCLNVRVHGKGTTLELRDVNSFNLPEGALADCFFAAQVYEVLLDLGGVTKAQKSLCSSRCVDGWVITSCIGCELDIYAKHLDDNDHVLVNCSMEKDPCRITSLIESENYSSLFKLLLPQINDNFVQNNFGIDLRSTDDSFERAVKHVQQQVSAYLRDEQKAMDERIRIFTEQQQARYSAIQQKVRKHKQSMVYLLLKMKEHKKPSLDECMMESISPVSPLSPTHNSSDDSSSSTDSALTRSKSEDHPIQTNVQIQEPSKIPFRRTHSVNNPPRTRAKGSLTSKQAARSIDAGGVFDMEGFENHDTEPMPFDNSDDDTDGSSAAEENTAKRENKNHEYAASLPMSVPAWSSYSRYSRFEEEEEETVQHFKDPDQIAASIRALAQSVRDGTEMFGDLPRRRLNTGDLIKSRPI